MLLLFVQVLDWIIRLTQRLHKNNFWPKFRWFYAYFRWFFAFILGKNRWLWKYCKLTSLEIVCRFPVTYMLVTTDCGELYKSNKIKIITNAKHASFYSNIITARHLWTVS